MCQEARNQGPSCAHGHSYRRAKTSPIRRVKIQEGPELGDGQPDHGFLHQP